MWKLHCKSVSLLIITHGCLYRWTENSFPFFFYIWNLAISKKCSNIIWTSLKSILLLEASTFGFQYSRVETSVKIWEKSPALGAELQSQNCVDVDYEKNTVRIYLKSFGTFSRILYCIFFCYCCFLSFICILTFRNWNFVKNS